MSKQGNRFSFVKILEKKLILREEMNAILFIFLNAPKVSPSSSLTFLLSFFDGVKKTKRFPSLRDT